MNDFIQKLRLVGIRIILKDGELSLKVPKSGADPILLQEIREKKEEIIRFLKEREVKKHQKIQKLADAEDYQLSSAQHRIWVLSQTEEGKIAYNIPGFYELHETLDKDALEATMNSLIDRHESLRTVFKENEQGVVRQQILSREALNFQVEYVDLSVAQLSQEQIKWRINDQNRVQFDLENGPLLKLTLFKLEEGKSVLSFIMHHIISDGWSMHVLLREFLIFYKSRGQAKLEDLEIQYRDYAAWQIEQLTGDSLLEHRNYWLHQFSGKLPVLQFPQSKQRPKVKTYNGEKVSMTFSKEVTGQLKSLVKEEGATLYMGLLSAVYSFLYRYTGQKDSIIGSPIAGRTQNALEGQIGFYVNTMALRFQMEEEYSFLDILRDVKKICSDAYEHQIYPFDSLVNELKLDKDLSRNPLFDVMLVLQEQDMTGVMMESDESDGELQVKPYEQDDQLASKFDFTFNFIEEAGEIYMSLVFNSDIYERTAIASALTHFENLVAGAVSDSAKALNSIDLLGEAERELLLKTFNNTTVEREANKTIVDLFTQKVAETPDAVAIRYLDKSLSYSELDELSSKFAGYITQVYQIDKELVGLKLPRTDWQIVVLLGILKTGSAYVPIDPNYPEKRIEYIEKDSACRLCIDEAVLEEFIDKQESYKNASLEFSFGANDLAYIIYTSGSTGLPKGVMIEHQSAVEMIEWALDEFAEDEFDKTLYVTSYCFDLSVYEIFFTLAAGKIIEVLQNGTAIEASLNTDEKVLINTVPSVVGALVNNGADFSSVVALNMAGEPIPPTLVKKLEGKVKTIRNLYGPSEDTTYSTICKLEAGQEVLIGKPISNTKVYILDDQNRLQPFGIEGEICITGKGLARGYLNQDALTKEKFIPSPFNPEDRMYKTGDLGRWTANGMIQFVGRKDDQVKVNGYRIELGEIKSNLDALSTIEESIVVAKVSASGDKHVVAYLVSKEALSAAEILNELSRNLPHYMLPKHIVQLDAFPLTPNGKIDKDALPDPVGLAIDAISYVAPTNAKQKALTSVFEHILGRPKVGIEDNFFILGGDSIKSIQVVSQLKQKGYNLRVEDILNFPIVRDLESKITSVSRLSDQTLMLGEVALSPIQRDFLEDSSVDKHHYNQAVLLQSNSSVSQEGLRMCLNKLVQHHDALRMVFNQTENHWIQQCNAYAENVELVVYEQDEEGEFLTHCEKLQESMDLNNGPLFKVLLQKGEQDKMLIVAHHLVIDGVSWRILFEDLSTLYEQFSEGKELALPLKTDSFDYWQKKCSEWLKNNSAKQEIAYWERIAEAGKTEIPVDFKEGTNLVKESEGWNITLSKQDTENLLTGCYEQYKTEINDLLLAGLSRSLGHVFNLDRVLIGLEGHGRENLGMDLDLSRTVGWFTSKYPLLLDTGKGSHATEHLIHVKEYLHRIPNNGVGYGILKPEMTEHVQNPQINFNYLGDFGSQMKSQSGKQVFEFASGEFGRVMSGNREREGIIDVSGIVVNGQLTMTLIYSKSQFKEETMQQIGVRFEAELLGLIQELSQVEKPQLTPVDLTFKELTLAQLNALNADGNLEDVYGLSPLQEGIYYHWSLDRSSPMYCNQMMYQFKADFDIENLKKSFYYLVNRHSMLRTSFSDQWGGKVLQIVKKEVKPNFRVINVFEETDFSPELFKKMDSATSFDLETGSQMRLSVLNYGDSKFEFIWNAHHVIVDAWSSGLLINEFFEIYAAFSQGIEPQLPRPYAYSNYIKWLDTLNETEAIEYWKSYFEGYEPKRILGRQVSEKEVENIQKELTFAFDEDLSHSVREVCRESGITENTFMQVVWGILLGKYLDTEDVAFGTVVAGRPPEVDGIDEMIGMFVNSVPVRINVNGASKIRELLLQNHKTLNQSSKYQFTQLADLYSATNLNADDMNNVLAFQNYPGEEVEASDVGGVLQSVEGVERVANDLTFYVVSDASLEARLVYNGSRFYDEQMHALKEHLRGILLQIVANPELKVQDIKLLTEQEKKQLAAFNPETTATNDRAISVMDVIEENVLKYPDHVALTDGHQSLTFTQLNEQTNQLAHYLKSEFDLEKDDIVGIKLENRTDVAICMLAILKTGAAFLPIDLGNPEERIEYIEKNSNAKVIVDEDMLSMFGLRKSRFSKENISRDTDGSELSYIIYTSGSTGRPKGVMIEGHSLYNYSSWFGKQFGLNTNDTSSLFNAVGFDGFVWDLIPYLMFGATVCVVPDELRKDVHALNEFMVENKITASFLPTKLAEILFTLENSELRLLFVGGDRLNIVPETSYEVFNMYGPTETTIVATFYPMKENQGLPIPIGKPTVNTNLYVLNDALEQVPVGIVGELCIGGPNLARGYFNDEELTQKKFVTLPENNERIYQTGDLVRWLPDGNIEFINRKDSQVKVRGYRIELGEIESHLDNHPEISACAVTIINEGGLDSGLVAYFVSDQPLEESDLKTYLKEFIPSYMIPGYFHRLEKMPMNINGKLDRIALKGLDYKSENLNSYQEPETSTEKQLAEIWGELLGREKIGKKDDFFEIGGHSLKATRLAGFIHNKFNVRLQITELFSHSTLEVQAQLIDASKKTTFVEIPQAGKMESYPLSSSQHRLWVLSHFDDANVAYNMPGHHLFNGEVSVELLQKSFDRLIQRHEVLRTVFREDENGEIRQWILPADQMQVPMQVVDLSTTENPIESVKDALKEITSQPFDLAEGPLLRFTLYKLGDEVHLFSYIIHHIISDGWSLRVMLKDTLSFYDAERNGEQDSLKPLRINYKDYAVWQQKELEGERRKTLESYWKNHLAGEIPVLALPTDKLRPAIQTYNGGTVSKLFGKDFSRDLKQYCKERNATIFMGLLAGINALLYRYTNQTDIIVGSVVAGRDHANLSDQIGFYVNTLPLRVQFDQDNNFDQLLKNVKGVTLGAFEHQALPFDAIVEGVSLTRDPSRSPLFDVMLVLQNTELENENGPVEETASLEIENSTSTFDLTFGVAEIGDDLSVSLSYNSDLYNKSTAERMLEHFQLYMQEAFNSEDTIASISYIGKSEKELLLDKFNSAKADYPQDKTVIELFEKQVAQLPEQNAICSAEGTLSYGELNARANQLAAYLRSEMNVQRGDLVAVMFSSMKVSLLTSILATLKCGGAYVPIDPTYPHDRIDYLTSNSQCKVVIDASFMETFEKVRANYSNDNTALTVQPEDLAYIIYTSGSTGKPKGVAVEHKSLVNLCTWQNKTYGITHQDRASLYITPAFDASVLETFPYLTAGATLYEIPVEIRLNVQAISEFMDENNITMSFLNTEVVEQFVEFNNGSLRYLLTGGDKMSFEKPTRYTIVNLYGPTENTVLVTNYMLEYSEERRSIPIGKPLDNVQVYILDHHQQLMPLGFVGELCVSGAGLARGYLNDQEQTAQKFVPNPLRDGQKMYKTGDLCRWLPDGNIEFIGRIDEQVKIRGYRIELGEIESALYLHNDIDSAAVLARKGKGGDKELIAFVVSKVPITALEMKNHLKSMLPDFMVPRAYVLLDKLPITSHGKIDARALLESETPALAPSDNYVAPRNEIEKHLVEIWQDVLGIDRVGVEDNFFEIGGHSIKAVKVVSRIQRELNIRIDMAKLFHDPSIAELAIEVANQQWQKKEIVEEEVVDKIVL